MESYNSKIQGFILCSLNFLPSPPYSSTQPSALTRSSNLTRWAHHSPSYFASMFSPILGMPFSFQLAKFFLHLYSLNPDSLTYHNRMKWKNDPWLLKLIYSSQFLLTSVSVNANWPFQLFRLKSLESIYIPPSLLHCTSNLWANPVGFTCKPYTKSNHFPWTLLPSWSRSPPLPWIISMAFDWAFCSVLAPCSLFSTQWPELSWIAFRHVTLLLNVFRRLPISPRVTETARWEGLTTEPLPPVCAVGGMRTGVEPREVPAICRWEEPGPSWSGKVPGIQYVRQKKWLTSLSLCWEFLFLPHPFFFSFLPNIFHFSRPSTCMWT